MQHAAVSQDAAAAVSVEAKVGHHKDEISEKSCCFRPLLCSTSVTESAEITAMSDAVNRQSVWAEDTTRALLLSEFDERFRRYRLSVPEAERALVDSLKRYGQMAPVVVCVCDGEFLLIDGFKRLAAARSIKGFDTLRARSIECDERSAKAALYNLNRVGRGVQEIEEA